MDVNLKQTIQSVIREVLQEEFRQQPDHNRAFAGQTQLVSIASDADLNKFAITIAKLCNSQEIVSQLERGAVQFTLSKNNQTTPSFARGNTVHLVEGLITEKKIRSLPSTTDKIVVSAGCIISPMALDIIRSRKIKIERSKQ
ncbi:MAG: hypothetical protein QM538_05295 [Methylacidiphilales bacterium]|nr:hypothetical protein [Candidatus Methylacidiphilales bacterium]